VTTPESRERAANRGTAGSTPTTRSNDGAGAGGGGDAIRAAAAIDLGAVVAGLLASPEWAAEPRSSSALLHTSELRVVLTALHRGATMHNDDPDEAITVQGIRGNALMSINGEGADLAEGSLLCVPAGVSWELSATTDAVVLLTVVPA
jgi:quercetin dioxygenase-like cupin family protein